MLPFFPASKQDVLGKITELKVEVESMEKEIAAIDRFKSRCDDGGFAHLDDNFYQAKEDRRILLSKIYEKQGTIQKLEHLAKGGEEVIRAYTDDNRRQITEGFAEEDVEDGVIHLTIGNLAGTDYYAVLTEKALCACFLAKLQAANIERVYKNDSVYGKYGFGNEGLIGWLYYDQDPLELYEQAVTKNEELAKEFGQLTNSLEEARQAGTVLVYTFEYGAFHLLAEILR